MRIVIDLQGVQSISSRSRGIGRYSMAISRALARNGGEHEIWLVLNSAFADTIPAIRLAFDGLIPANQIRCFSALTDIGAASPPPIWRVRAAELMREAFMADLQPDVVFVSSLFEGMLDDCVTSVNSHESSFASAVVLYDLIPYMNRDTYFTEPILRAWYDSKIESLTRSNLLLSISECARQEAIDALNLPQQKVVNISTAVSDMFKPLTLASDDLQNLLNRYQINKPFIMHNGAFEARKNLDRLVRSFAMLPPSIKDNHCLLLVGKASDLDRKRLFKLAAKLEIREQLILPGYVSDEDLIALYSNCVLFVFPSLHEGFGLPALEAMSCGSATIGSNSSSIPEVINLPEALFDPNDKNSIAAKMQEALSDSAFHQHLCEHGLRQAKNFSWDASAIKALNAFESLPTTLNKKESAKSRYQHLISGLSKLPGYFINRDLQEVARSIDRNRYQTAPELPDCSLPVSICWRIEGPFDSSYSLALLNRETARALSALGHKVSLHSTEGPGDFEPNPHYLKANPDLASMHALSKKIAPDMCQVVSRNLYPPRVADMSAPLNLLHHYAWEESGFPSEWVDSFNENLQGITCLSQHVQKILTDHGVRVPLSTSGCGVDHWLRIEADTKFSLKAKSFRFLHVSSCFPRKGVDALLEAYGNSFSATDDVSLVIKTFTNPHNEIEQLLAEYQRQKPAYPDVVIIEEDLTDSELKAIYEQCHCLVAPSRAEGFGLPMAEAMLSDLPVITTAWGGQTDFCTEETAWLVDYTFVPAQTHFNLHDSVWADPDVDQLGSIMLDVYKMDSASRKEKPQQGKKLLLDKFRWQDVAVRLETAARTRAEHQPPPPPRVGWVTTWNVRCGIAAYSAQLLDKIPMPTTVLACHAVETITNDSPEVERCWTINGHSSIGNNLDRLGRVVNEHKLDILVIQFNYSFFHMGYLSRFVDEQIAAGRLLIFTMHSTTDRPELSQGELAPLIPALRKCHRICVHSVNDLNRLKRHGLVDNVVLFPLGILDYSSPASGSPKNDKTMTIASYGFFLPHKGLLELIEAVDILVKDGNKVRLLMVNAEYPVPESANLIQQAHENIAKSSLADKVEVITDYLEDKKSLALLAEADLIVYPYQVTGESASAAVRYGLTAGRPVAVTPLSIFDDVDDAVFRLPGMNPKMIAQGIKQLLTEKPSVMEQKQGKADKWRASHRYSHLGKRMHGMLCSLHNL